MINKSISTGQIVRRIRAKEISSVYILWGDDFLLQDMVIDQLKEQFIPQGSKKTFHMGIDDEMSLMNELTSLSLFDDKKLIVVKNIKKISSKYYKEILEYVSSSSLDTVLVFAVNDAYYKTKFIESVSKEATNVDTRVPFPNKMKEWVGYKSKTEGMNISQNNLDVLIDLYGDNSINVYNEIVKLSIQYGDSAFDMDISTNSRIKKDSQVWKLVDYVGKKDYRSAINSYNSLYTNNVGIGTIIFNLFSLFRDMLVSRIDKGQQKGKYVRNKILLKNYNIYSSNYSIEENLSAIKFLRDCDFLSKTTSINQKILLSIAMLQICETKID